MDDLFGLSMNYIMIGLLVVLAVAFASVGYVVLRSRVMFRMGLRNMPRRIGQTVLIVIGLMLSTLIISAAFTTGDQVHEESETPVFPVPQAPYAEEVPFDARDLFPLAFFELDPGCDDIYCIEQQWVTPENNAIASCGDATWLYGILNNGEDVSVTFYDRAGNEIQAVIPGYFCCWFGRKMTETKRTVTQSWPLCLLSVTALPDSVFQGATNG